MALADINDQGVSVTLASGTVVKAMYIADATQFQKYLPPDGQMMGRAKIDAIFVFPGAQEPNIKGGSKLIFRGISYTINTPPWTRVLQDVCITVAVSAFIAGR